MQVLHIDAENGTVARSLLSVSCPVPHLSPRRVPPARERTNKDTARRTRGSQRLSAADADSLEQLDHLLIQVVKLKANAAHDLSRQVRFEEIGIH